MSNPKAIQKLDKIPILYYEDEGDAANPIPYIPVGQHDLWPVVLFVQEYRESGEFEPDSEGNPSPICDMYMHKYIDEAHLKERLTPELYDEVRVAMGLDPINKARAKGQELLSRVYAKAGIDPTKDADDNNDKESLN